MASLSRSLATDHLLVFVADGAEPVMAGHNVELAAVFANPNIAASEMEKRRVTLLATRTSITKEASLAVNPSWPV